MNPTDATSQSALLTAPVVAVIPARRASTRLPDKPLLAETGRPMILHVVEQVLRAKVPGNVMVATDDAEIAQVVREAGAAAEITRPDHPNGSSRIAEVMGRLPAFCPQAAAKLGIDPASLPIVLNVQGDEPEINPDDIDRLAQAMLDAAAAAEEPVMFTLAAPLTSEAEAMHPGIVKVVTDQRGRAMYFSRSVIPWSRDGGPVRRLRHAGVYAYRRDFLMTYPDLAPTPLEQAESLEQLRVLEHGFSIGVVEIEKVMDGIDTPEQYRAFVNRYLAAQQR